MARASSAIIVAHGGAIWSTSAEQMLQHPLQLALSDSGDNHGLLQFIDRPCWRTVQGGSRSYVRRMVADGTIDLRLNARISAVLRDDLQPSLIFADGSRQIFDAVVLATHADQALKLLAAANAAGKRSPGRHALPVEPCGPPQ